MKKLLFIALLGVSALSAQEGLLVTQTDGPPHDNYTKLFFVSATSTYICFTKASGEPTTQTVTGITNANPAALTIPAHGFNTTSRPTVTLQGFSGSESWSGVNTTFIATVVNENTLSLPFDSTTFGTVSGAPRLITNAPRLSRPIWSIQKVDTDTNGNPVSALWALGGYNNVCANRASLSYQ